MAGLDIVVDSVWAGGFAAFQFQALSAPGNWVDGPSWLSTRQSPVYSTFSASASVQSICIFLSPVFCQGNTGEPATKTLAVIEWMMSQTIFQTRSSSLSINAWFPAVMPGEESLLESGVGRSRRSRTYIHVVHDMYIHSTEDGGQNVRVQSR